ncbi:MAG: hypothetical protein QF785_06955, partial [Phycisphaeraceae bacterium]|nr:hypothetical protein [Phycisphaeraceae bacterium]
NSGPSGLQAADGGTLIVNLRIEAWCLIAAFLMTAVFLVYPGPYQMVLFVFIAQPLFAIAIVMYSVKVLRELGKKGVL